MRASWRDGGPPALVLVPLLLGCAATYERASERALERVERRLATPGARAPRGVPARLERGVEGYLAFALAHSPQLRASFERWRAGVHRIARARRLPEPTVSYGLFVRSIETRVGPQRHRLGLQQSFPWPTRLTAGADAASAQARALERRFDAEVLALRQRVVEAYWRLWLVRRTRVIQREQLELLLALSESARARIATGATTLADQQQVDLSTARLDDAIAGLDELERAAEAQLRAATGLEASTSVPTPGEPPAPVLPAESEESLRAAAARHPAIAALGLMSEAAHADARSQAADRLPSFTVGVDWVITEEARMAGVAGSGDDAVMVGVGLRLPLWQGSYAEAESASEAESAAFVADRRAATDRALGELAAALSALRDAVRRVNLHEHTLLPQAEAAFQSVLGAYAIGRSTVSAGVLAQRELLELRLGSVRARVDAAIAWTRVELVTGRPVRRAGARRTP